MLQTHWRQKSRHPLEVTADRLGNHYETYYDQLTAEERDDLSRVRHAFLRIAEHARDRS